MALVSHLNRKIATIQPVGYSAVLGGNPRLCVELPSLFERLDGLLVVLENFFRDTTKQHDVDIIVRECA
jgi:hypothetical protein